MKPVKIISKWEAYCQKPKKLPSFRRKLCLRKDWEYLPEQLILRLLSNRIKLIPEAKETLNIQTDPVEQSCIYDLSQKVEWFTVRNILNHLSQWKSISSDPFIIDIVKIGLKLRFANEPVQNICYNTTIIKTERHYIKWNLKTVAAISYISLHERRGRFYVIYAILNLKATQ